MCDIITSSLTWLPRHYIHRLASKTVRRHAPDSKVFFFDMAFMAPKRPFFGPKSAREQPNPIQNHQKQLPHHIISTKKHFFTNLHPNHLQWTYLRPLVRQTPKFHIFHRLRVPPSPNFCFQKSSSSSPAPSSAQKQLVLLYKYWLNIFISEFFDFVNSTISSFSYFHHFASFLLFQERKKVRRGLEPEQRTAWSIT